MAKVESRVTLNFFSQGATGRSFQKEVLVAEENSGLTINS